MDLKYILLDETILFKGRTLHRIEALKDFGDVKKGDKGGWIESEFNLSHCRDCWVDDNAKVYGGAYVCGDAKVYGDARVSGDCWISGDALVYDNAQVYNCAHVHGDALVHGNAQVCGTAVVDGKAEICGDAVVQKTGDCLVFQNWWSSGRWFTYTASNKKWKVGCFHGTGEELIAKAYADIKKKGECYEAIVKAVEKINSNLV